MDKIIDDKRAADLLSRVRDDIASLQHDVKHLVTHAGRHTLPDALRNSRDYAREGVERAGRIAREHPAGVSLGGVLLLGAVAAGIWLVLKGDCCGSAAVEGDASTVMPPGPSEDHPGL